MIKKIEGGGHSLEPEGIGRVAQPEDKEKRVDPIEPIPKDREQKPDTVEISQEAKKLLKESREESEDGKSQDEE